jgi:hypothetical protein
VRSLSRRAVSARGTLRSNPPLGGPTLTVGRLTLRLRRTGFAIGRDLRGELVLEGGRPDAGAGYGRLAASVHALAPVGATHVLLRAHAGLGTEAMPAHRAFVLGGRGTLPGDDFRSWGGRTAAWAHVEWRVPVGGLTLGAGRYARLPASIIVAPYVAAGAAGRPVAGTPWRATPDARVTTGIAIELLGVLRVDAGYGLQSRRARLSLDVTRNLWEIL